MDEKGDISIVEMPPLQPGDCLAVRCTGSEFASPDSEPWLSITLDGETGKVSRGNRPFAGAIEITDARREMEALVNRYIFLHKWRPPKKNHRMHHPCVKAIADEFNAWITERLGGPNAFWAMLLAAATIWFDEPEDFATLPCKYFCIRFEGTGNIGADHDEGYRTICQTYLQWKTPKRQLARELGLINAHWTFPADS
jgi:hypothetical protein